MEHFHTLTHPRPLAPARTHGDGQIGFANDQPNAARLQGPVPEEYARLHTELERASVPSRCFIVGVTSAVFGEGKTTVAMNLAGTIANNSTQRVALMDMNLRTRDLQQRLNLGPCSGLVDVLEGAVEELESVIHRTELDNFTVIPAGRAAGNPARLSRSPQLVDTLTMLRAANDFIVMDMAPVLPVTDTRVLARAVDGIIMVVRAGVTPRDIVARAIDAVGSDRVLGVVMNRTETSMPGWLQRYFGGSLMQV